MWIVGDPNARAAAVPYDGWVPILVATDTEALTATLTARDLDGLSAVGLSALGLRALGLRALGVCAPWAGAPGSE